MARVCFTLQVRADRLDEYRRRHAAVWPEMLEALDEAGWHDYSLFLREDGLLVGYLETADFAAAQEAMQTAEVNARWQAQMVPFFEGLEGAPDTGMTVLSEIFNIDDQLAAARRAQQ
jgi:L-rhamnose mutarotase